MPYFLVWVILAILVGVYADKKGRSGVGFFFLSLLLSPLIGFLVALAAEPKREKVAANTGMKKCPDCGEYVRGEARICRFCRHEFWAADAASPPNEPTGTQSNDFDPWPRKLAVSEPASRPASFGHDAAPISPTTGRKKIVPYLIVVAFIIAILWLSLSAYIGH